MPETIYRRKTDNHKRFYCNAGSIYENEYQEQINKKTGCLELVKIGKKNIYELIQQDLESTKIENILHKLAIGDYSVLKQAQLTYVDESDFPKSLMEAQNIVIKAKQEFEAFPVEVKKLFNNSAEQYVSEIGTNTFLDKMAPFNDDALKKQKAEKDAEFNEAVKNQVAFNKAVNAAMSEEVN